MRSLDEINAANGSDGQPLLDTHPGRTAGLPEPTCGFVPEGLDLSRFTPCTRKFGHEGTAHRGDVR